MKKTEKSAIALLFLLVVIAFSFAQRDSKKLYFLYNNKSVTTKWLKVSTGSVPISKS